MTNEQLIHDLIQKDDMTLHNKAYSYFLKKHERCFRKIIGIKYSNAKYNREEVYGITMSLLYPYLMEDDARKLRTIKNYDLLDSWIYVTSLHFSEAIRKQVDEELGLDHYDNENQLTNHKGDDEEQTDYEEEDRNSEIGNPDAFDDDIDQPGHDVIDEPTTEDFSPETKLQKLISLIPHSYYQKIITYNKIYGMSIVDLAEEFGMTRSRMDMDLSRAMFELTRVSLPYIQKQSILLFRKSGHFLSQEQYNILYAFFVEKKSPKEISVLESSNEKDTLKKLVNAFKQLKKEHENHLKDYFYEYTDTNEID